MVYAHCREKIVSKNEYFWRKINAFFKIRLRTYRRIYIKSITISTCLFLILSHFTLLRRTDLNSQFSNQNTSSLVHSLPIFLSFSFFRLSSSAFSISHLISFGFSSSFRNPIFFSVNTLTFTAICKARFEGSVFN